MRALAVIALLIGACSQPAKEPATGTPPPASTPAAQKETRSIGSATMTADGTLKLMLRAEGGGAVGDALLVYPKGHKEYDNILRHLGGLKPGETKPVPPFPSK